MVSIPQVYTKVKKEKGKYSKNFRFYAILRTEKRVKKFAYVIEKNAIEER